MKLGFLCNSRLGIPSLQTLLYNNIPFSLAVPDVVSEDMDYIKTICHQHKKSYTIIHKEKVYEELEEWINKEKPDLITVMTFPYIIPEKILQHSTVQWYNFHFAPLPQYRGAEPIFWLIKNREVNGGITIHQMTKKLDEGPVFSFNPVPIASGDTHGMHMYKLALCAPDILFQFLMHWERTAGQISLQEQNNFLAKTYPKAKADDLTVKWDKMDAIDIKALVQAANPWNKGAITFLDQNPVRICELAITTDKPHEKVTSGQLSLVDNKLLVCSKDRIFLDIKVIATDVGLYSGKKFAEIYNPQGKKFT